MSHYDIIVFVRTVRTFTTHGECGYQSLGLRPMRLIVESGNVRGSKCKPRSYVPEMKTQGHGYRADLELSDRSWG